MAGNNERVSTDQVAAIANEIDSINHQLSDKLKDCQQTFDNLSGIWQGEAAQTSIQNFDAFANKYFQQYEDIIDSYVKFLRTNVEQGYTETETQNVNLADAYKG